MAQLKARTVPAHVPPELVVDFDMFEVPLGMQDPLDKWRGLLDEKAPKIFWSPFNGGHWTFLTYQDIREAYRDFKHFSTRHKSIPPTEGFPVFQPNGVDPPDNSRFRNLLAPFFTPAAIEKMKHEIRRRSRALIENFVADGHCDFVAQYSARLPSAMFIHLMGMDESRVPEFVELTDIFMRSDEVDAKAKNVADIYAVLEEFFARKQSTLGDDLASVLLKARDARGSTYTHEEIVNCAFLLFVAGLDTVTSTMTYVWSYLAQTPEARAFIAANLDKSKELTLAVDELLRVNAVSNIYRRVTEDIVYRGLTLKTGDMVVLPNNLANRDSAAFDHPTSIDLGRKINTHLTFGLGAHRCLGSHLAKSEITASLREWLLRIPEFRVRAGAQIPIFAGPVMGLRSLPLEWEVAGRG